ncbi:heme-binding protein [Demequina gelatinilytica]|uniref:heme-binding protein n=1 Tax=Demequina gelatinilytica TaxID=1638980 RepID=UPI000784CE8E|nr:heme-binding protein [Demequina gelatinilytica]
MLTVTDSLYTEKYRANSRVVEVATTSDEELGPFKLLPGTWKNTDRLRGRGWNMIALPFAAEGGALDYRLLVNQFDEELKFSLVDKRVPNRGIDLGEPGVRGDSSNTDQLVVTLDYEQMIEQIAADDSPGSGLAGAPELAIHHEPGLFLHMGEPRTDGISIARLASIPHGNSALALGTFLDTDQPARIEDISGLPIGAFPPPADGVEISEEELLERAYLAPYKHFHDNNFQGLFDPVHPNALLNALPTDVVRNTVLFLDTTLDRAGVHNIPFVERQADVTDMKATFWILELDGDGEDAPNLLLAYTQTVMLEFFPRRDGQPGLIRWPHVSINVMEKVVEEATPEKPSMPSQYYGA